MRQDAPRSIGEQLNRPDTTGAAGFRQGVATGLRRALENWEAKNDPISRRFGQEPHEDASKKPKAQPSRLSYRQKLKTLTDEQLAELRARQKASTQKRNEKIMAEKIAAMTPEELAVFRERSERMKKFRKELKERKQQSENTL